MAIREANTPDGGLAALPFAEATTLWLESRRLFLSPRSFADYEKYFKTAGHFFGELTFGDIEIEHIRAYLSNSATRDFKNAKGFAVLTFGLSEARISSCGGSSDEPFTPCP